MLVLPAELMHHQASTCSRMLGQAIRSEPGPEVLADVSALERFDSSALAVLLECRRESMVAGKRFAVVGWPARLRELAALYGIAELLSPDAATSAGPSDRALLGGQRPARAAKALSGRGESGTA